jgi:MFS family permease
MKVWLMASTTGKIGLLQAFSALKHRNFQLFFTGQLISLIGTWMQNIAQDWLILVLTNSPFLLGLVTAVQFTPMLLLSLVAGEVADRFPKRRLLLITQGSMMACALILGLLVLTGHVRYWHVLILAALLGTSNAFDNPIRQSFIVELVGKEDLMNAITLNSSVFNGARVIGPALAGLAIGYLGMAPCFLINAASFAAILPSLALIRIQPRSGRPPADKMIWQNIGEGLQFIRRTPIILTSMLLMAMLNIFAMNQSVLVPVLSKMTLHQGAAGYGFLSAASGIGAVLGALYLAATSSLGPQRRMLYAGGIGLCVFQILLAASRNYGLAFLLLFCTGLSMNIFTPLVNSTIQLNVQDKLRGRVMSVYTIAFLGLTPLGSLFSGSIAHIWGAPAAFAAGAVIALACLLVILIWERRRRAAAASRV